MSDIARNHKNGFHDSTVEDRDLQLKLTTAKFGLIFNF